jgi:hypothetical protein
VACSSSEDSTTRRRVDRDEEAGVDAAASGGRGTGGTGGRATGGGTPSSGGADGGVPDASVPVADASIGEDGSAATPDASISGDASSGADAADAGPVKIVFVSSAVYDGNLGGVLGADAKCQALADAAGLGGTFLAWLSDTTSSPAARFTRTSADYVLADRTTVFAHGWTGLTTQPALHPLNMTELGLPPTSVSGSNTCATPPLGHGSATWGSTNLNGEPSPGVADGLHTCEDWTSVAVPAASNVSFGDPTGNSGTWAGFCNTGANVCASKASLDCFEQ